MCLWCHWKDLDEQDNGIYQNLFGKIWIQNVANIDL
jgi:hypothetical protein